MSTEELLTVKPIGIFRSHRVVKFDTPHQPDPSLKERCAIELIPDVKLSLGLRDLEGFEKIWLVWWFHRNTTWNPLVIPPRGEEKKRGVFATRSPHRPNPIGITAVDLLEIESNKVYVGSNDLLDGTPILDIKPYLVSADSFPGAKCGWVDEVDAELALPPTYKVHAADLAKEQIKWLESNNVDILHRAVELLERDPTPHRTRRIKKCSDEGFRIDCGAWRLYFSVKDKDVLIEKVAPGFPLSSLMDPGYESVPHREEQLGFHQIWPIEG